MRTGETVIDHPEGGDGTYIGEVDDPNFVTGTDTGTSPSSGSNNDGSFIGEVDDPSFVSGGQTDSTGGSGGGTGGDTSGSGGGTGGDTSGSGGGTGDTSGSGGGTGDTSGSGGTGQPSGFDNDQGTATSGTRPGRGPNPNSGMENPETGVGEGPLPRGFLQGGYAVTTHTILNVYALHEIVQPITPALFALHSLPLLGDSSVGAILVHAGILRNASGEALPPTLMMRSLPGVA